MRYIKLGTTGLDVSPIAIGISPVTYNIVGYYDNGPASVRLSYVWNDEQISSTPNQNSVPVAQLRTDGQYRMLGRLPFDTSYGSGSYEIWVRNPST